MASDQSAVLRKNCVGCNETFYVERDALLTCPFCGADNESVLTQGNARVR